MFLFESNIYIFRHYWNEKGSATIEPSWITEHAENLSSTQQKIKVISKKLLDPSKYVQLSQTRLNRERMDGYYIYYCYHKKNDPDPANLRMVTEITFYISHKEIFTHLCNLDIPADYVIKQKEYVNIMLFLVSLFSMAAYYLR